MGKSVGSNWGLKQKNEMKINFFGYTKERESEESDDCFFPDVTLTLTKDEHTGYWFVSILRVELPYIEEFNELADVILKTIKGTDAESINEIVQLLLKNFDDSMPSDYAEKFSY